MPNIDIRQKCKKCGYNWNSLIVLIGKKPVLCPKCHNREWDKCGYIMSKAVREKMSIMRRNVGSYSIQNISN